MSIIGYFLQAGLVVKSVMLILLLASIVSWTLIFQKFKLLSQQKQEDSSFYQAFWNSKDLSSLYKSLEARVTDLAGGAAIFYAGFQEFYRQRQNGKKDIELDLLSRVMQISQVKQSVELEAHLSLFSSIGSIAPYVGLFGTVWGIMTSLQALGQAQQATIAMVAPGISEALVATALGLFTAIPAVMAYHRYSTMVTETLNSYDLFQDEFLTLVEQQRDKKA